MISRFFIDRPIFAAVISIIIMLAGLVAMRALPIAQFPEITPPLLQVVTSYPGANAETTSNSVAAPVEQQVNGVESMIYMQSNNSASGDMALNIYFNIGTNVDAVLPDLTNRVNLANPVMPSDVRQNGLTIKKASSNILMIAAISSDGSQDPNFVSNYANINVVDELKRIPGASQVNLFTQSDYAMRIWLKPDRMAELNFTVNDIRQAIQEQNAQFAVGKVGQQPTGYPVELTLPVSARGRLSEPKEFEEIILRSNPDGSAVLLRDVARVELGIRSYDTEGLLNGKRTDFIMVYQQPGSNALDVAEKIIHKMEEIKKNFPSGISYSIPYNTTKFVEVSIEAVVHTFFEAVILVILVVFLFLQNWRATLIPLLAVPVSIVGTFAGMYMLGFSINTLTLFGMILAIGIVVDDAIVVIENVERNMHEFGLDAKEAARRAMDEVTGPVIAIVLVLCAVFIPTAFLSGITGQLYKQFAITIAISVFISGVVALTLSPALAAILLKPAHGQKNIFFRGFDAGFDWMTGGYVAGSSFLLRRVLIGLALFGGLLFITFGLFAKVPSGFVPDEDQGYLLGVAILPDGASMERTREVVNQANQIFGKHPAVANVVSLNGFSLLDSQNKPNFATFFLPLKDWKERETPELHAFETQKTLQREVFQQIKEAQVVLFNPPPIPGMSSTGGFEFWIQDRGGAGSKALEEAVQKFIAKAKEKPELGPLATTFRANSQQLFVDLDREKARALNVPIDTVFDLLQGLFGSIYVNDFNKLGRTFRVMLQADTQYRTRPEDISQVFVRSTTGQMVPLSALVNVKYITGPDNEPRFNVFPAARVNGNAASGYSSGQALAAMEALAKEALPEGMSYAWAGQAFQEKQVGAASAMAFVFGIIMVFLILAAQYEKWALPIAVITAVPFAVAGALLAVWLRGLVNDVYFQIGLVTLIALAAKNAILIIEFAVMKREEGLSAMDAALEAARLRFRPIVMTSLAFILGCVPLAISTGAGAFSRHSIGTGVIGGMLGATCIAIFFVPLFYRLFSGKQPPSISEPAPNPTLPHDPAMMPNSPEKPAAMQQASSDLTPSPSTSPTPAVDLGNTLARRLDVLATEPLPDENQIPTTAAVGSLEDTLVRRLDNLTAAPPPEQPPVKAALGSLEDTLVKQLDSLAVEPLPDANQIPTTAAVGSLEDTLVRQLNNLTAAPPPEQPPVKAALGGLEDSLVQQLDALAAEPLPNREQIPTTAAVGSLEDTLVRRLDDLAAAPPSEQPPVKAALGGLEDTLVRRLDDLAAAPPKAPKENGPDA